MSIDATTVITAAISAVGLGVSTIIPVVVTRRAAARTAEKVDNVHAEVRTNHGMRAGEYLELLTSIQSEVASQGRVVAHLAQAWGDHTVSDAVSFEEITKRLAGIEAFQADAMAQQRKRRRTDRGSSEG